MKKLIVLLAIAFCSCTPDEQQPDRCRTINSKESKVEWQHDNVYSPNYYFILDGVKTKVTKSVYDDYSTGNEYCTTLSY